jgi:hypothetical protein
MDSQMNEPIPMASNGTDMFSNKNFIIYALLFLLVLSFLGINLLNIVGNGLQDIISIFGPAIAQILSVFGYTAGNLIDKSADVVTDVSKTGIDVAGGALHSVGGLLKNASQPNINEEAKRALDNPTAPLRYNTPKPDSASNPIQNPISSAKTSWCLVGEYEGRRGCIEIGDQDKCLSGQVFPQQQMCLNPTMTNNMPGNALKSVRE